MLIQTTPVQNFLVSQVTRKLSSDLKTNVSIRHVRFALFNSMLLQQTLIEDRKHDTLLYAGSIRLNITDWFFFKDKVELEYIGLEDAVIHLNRTDSVWNYHFLINYFTSPTPAEPSQTNIDLNLRKLEMSRVSIIQRDEWRGEDMRAAIKALNVNADEINFNKRLVRIKDFQIDEPALAIYDYPGRRVRRPATDDGDPEIVNDTANLRWNPGKWDVTINRLVLNDGRFSNDIKTDRPVHTYFDGAHIAFSEINGNFTNVRLRQDSITASAQLATNERSGFVVKKLSSQIRFHPEAMEFNDLDLVTNQSHLHNYFAMRYSSFDDMNDFISRVRMEGNFDNSIVSSDDIAFFAPELGDWKKKFRINGVARGTVDNLNAKNMVVEAGHDTYLKGNISMSGLPDIDKTYIDFEAENFRTTYKDAVSFVPQLKNVKQPDLSILEYLRFRGNFTGFFNDFVTYGSLETGLGTLVTDLNMKLRENGLARYSGNIRTDEFDAGRFLGNASVGKLSFQSKVNGRGLSAKDVNAELDGTIRLFEFNDYPYRNISVRGNVAKSLFNGELLATDPNLQAQLNGLVDFGKDVPEFNFTANISKADLYQLKLMREQVDFYGKFNVDFRGNNIDNFLGTARIYDASAFRQGKKISFDSLYIESKIIDSNKVLTALSNEFDAALVGEFSLKELPGAFQTFLNKYYPAYIKPSKQLSKRENFTFVVSTKNVDEYIGLIHPDLSGFNFSTITGRLDNRQNLLDLNVEIPQFNYKNVGVYDLKLKATGQSDSLQLQADVANVYINDSLNFPATVINLSSAKDISEVDIHTSASQTLNSANIRARVQTLPEGARIRFRDSDFDINGKKWTIEKDGVLMITENLVSAEKVKLYSGFQEINITTVPSGTIAGVNDIKVDLQKINIGDFAPFAITSNRLEGLLTGSISVTDPFGKTRVDVNAVTDQFRLDDDSIGHITLKGKYYRSLNEVNFNAAADNPSYNFDVQGIYQLGDSARAENLDVFTNLRKTRVDILERYLSGVFTDISGFASGALRINGPTKNLDYLGTVYLSDATLRVKYTNVLYKIPYANIELKEDRIDFGSFSFEDERRNKAQISRGILYHEGFNDLSFDFAVNTNKLQVLSTGSASGDPYYGSLVARASMTLTGPLNDMVMNIEGEPTDSSYLYINTKSGKQSGQADFVVWKVYGREMQRAQLSDASNITVNLDVTANNYATMYVVMDELTGDIIQATGRGNLKMRATTNGEFTIHGRYNIDRGNYNFSFESLLKKPFRLREETANFIQWSGDPNDATIAIEAEYAAENVRFSDLGLNVQQISSGRAFTAYRGAVLVVASLTEQLLSPEIAFRLELPANSPLRNDETAQRLLATIGQDQNELNRQVAFLVVFNSFGPFQNASQSNLANTAIEGIVIGSISGVLSNSLSRQFSDVFQKIFNDKSIRVNFNAQFYNNNQLYLQTGVGSGVGPNPGSTGSRSAFNIDRSNFNLSVQKNLFNERLSFSLGSAVDVGLTADQVSATRSLPFLPDITAEWKVTPDGKIVLSFFYRDSYNYFSRAGYRQNRSGASISFRREFEHTAELFREKPGRAAISAPIPKE